MRPREVVQLLNVCARSSVPLSCTRTLNEGGTLNAGGVAKSPCREIMPLALPGLDCGRSFARVKCRFWFAGVVVDVVLVATVVVVAPGSVVVVVPPEQLESMSGGTPAASE